MHEILSHGIENCHFFISIHEQSEVYNMVFLSLYEYQKYLFQRGGNYNFIVLTFSMSGVEIIKFGNMFKRRNTLHLGIVSMY